MTQTPKTQLERSSLSAGLRLSLLWASLMFLWIYNDYFSMYLPGTIENMTNGRIGPFEKASASVMVGLSLMLAIPALMIFLSSALPPVLSRWLNMLLGLAYTVIDGLTFIGSEPFYQMVVGAETAVTLLIVWTALRWPREAAA